MSPAVPWFARGRRAPSHRPEESMLSPVLLARIQFGFIAAFHILWPPLTVGLAFILFALEFLWHRSGEEFYYRQARFWSRLFLLNFGIGVATGVPLEFSFGTNWKLFSIAAGNFFGNILGFETVIAFMLEAGFVGIMIFGWRRVPPIVHLFATAMVALGSVLSVFWIMVANSWMQTPTGTVLRNGRFVVTNYWKAIFNPDLVYAFWHMLVACLELSLVVVAGVSAWYLYQGRNSEFFFRIFRLAALLAALVAPTQILIGDSAGRALATLAPAKLAAIEAHWHTNSPGHGASWALLAAPDATRQDNRWAIKIPDALSLLIRHSATGRVLGLTSFPRRDQPPVWIPFYAFRLMVVSGFFVAGAALWTLIVAARGELTSVGLTKRRGLLRAWILSIPATYLAIEAGWFTREIGRQPWVVYGLMRTSAGTSDLAVPALIWSLFGYVVIYAVVGVSGFYFARRIIEEGPDFATSVPALPKIHRTPRPKAGRRPKGGASE
ncbi:MAG: cytochrome ubiquinol oxidase subunit I [Acidiferrobacteraceae bacterium]